MDVTENAVTRLLDRVRDGDREALDEVFVILYDELRDLARRQRRRWQGNATLNTTALIHEAWVKLAGGRGHDLEDRGHFRSLASKVMRHVLCDYARQQAAQRRGGGLDQMTLETDLAAGLGSKVTSGEPEALVALDEALGRLERLAARQAEVVECRFFGGLSVDETAAALDISPRTVKRDWSLAQAWLHREMSADA
jgi:RNA polymerase sigma factor (TIGR02999 family)